MYTIKKVGRKYQVIKHACMIMARCDYESDAKQIVKALEIQHQMLNTFNLLASQLGYEPRYDE